MLYTTAGEATPYVEGRGRGKKERNETPPPPPQIDILENPLHKSCQKPQGPFFTLNYCASIYVSNSSHKI
jgi:hypothetical protein